MTGDKLSGEKRPKLPVNHDDNVAFALGGLPGSNAHGAGFLAAAAEVGFRPKIISCTSGMIDWTARWLAGRDLAEELRNLSRGAAPFPPTMQALNWQYVMTHGMAGVFRPAAPEYWRRVFTAPPPLSTEALLGRMLPAELWAPVRSDSDFKFIADTFNASDIAIFFNSYEPTSGVEFLHMNPAAQALYDRGEHKRKRRAHPARDEMALIAESNAPRVVADVVTPEAVRDAMWLIEYGFGTREHPQRRVDGSYIRQLIVSDLTQASAIFTARPMTEGWRDDPPANWLESRDLESELAYIASYREQISRIDLINRLIRNGMLNNPDFGVIDMIPVEVPVSRGYFDYFVEQEEVFDRARIAAHHAFIAYMENPPPVLTLAPAVPPAPSPAAEALPGDVPSDVPAAPTVDAPPPGALEGGASTPEVSSPSPTKPAGRSRSRRRG